MWRLGRERKGWRGRERRRERGNEASEGWVSGRLSIRKHDASYRTRTGKRGISLRMRPSGSIAPEEFRRFVRARNSITHLFIFLFYCRPFCSPANEGMGKTRLCYNTLPMLSYKYYLPAEMLSSPNISSKRSQRTLRFHANASRESVPCKRYVRSVNTVLSKLQRSSPSRERPAESRSFPRGSIPQKSSPSLVQSRPPPSHGPSHSDANSLPRFGRSSRFVGTVELSELVGAQTEFQKRKRKREFHISNNRDIATHNRGECSLKGRDGLDNHWSLGPGVAARVCADRQLV